MLDTFTVATFEPYVGGTFRARLAGSDPIDLTLVEASPLTTDEDPRRRRVPFRLMFLDPSRRIGRQAIFELDHDGFEPMAVFLVPVRADEAGHYVEAIFT